MIKSILSILLVLIIVFGFFCGLMVCFAWLVDWAVKKIFGW